MKHTTTILLLLFLLSATAALAQANEYYFKFDYSNRAQLDQLTRIISIDNVKDGVVFAYANDKQFEQFKALGYEYTILPHPGTLHKPKMTDSVAEAKEWDSYPTYDAYVDMMYQFAADYPSICSVENIGYSVEGRELLVAKLSDNVGNEENEPEVFYTSTMHGDETAGYILTLRLIDSLCTTYGTDTRVTNLLNSMEVYINPLANPDGSYASGNHTIFGATRGNARGVDLNRNFPDPDEGPHPDGNEWQEETLAMMDFARNHTMVISANFHGGAEVVNYPWDTWPRRHADDAWWITISREWADSAQYYSPSGYMTDLNNGITNGWDWYSIAGGRQDYMNYYHGCREATIELSHTKLLPENQLENWWNYNRISLFNWLENAYYGFQGTVTDIDTGLPLEATVVVVGHDMDNSYAYSDPDHGNYIRMIEPGTWDLQFTAEGYTPLTLEDHYIGTDDVVTLNIELEPFSGQEEVIYADDFSTDQGWTGLGGQGEWTIGVCTGGEGNDNYGGPDPSQDHTPTSDNKVLGNDLTSGNGGDYSANLGSTYWVTSPTIDCSDYFAVSFEFYRWLGVERDNYDEAFLQGYNGSSWVTLFENGSSTIDESSWGLIAYDVSTIADGNADFRIRFGIGPTDGSWQYCGWNIDDIEVRGWTSGTPSDLTIDMIPDDPPIEVPRGGSFTFTGVITNNTEEQQTTDVWIMLDVPDYGMYGPVTRFNNISLNPNQTLTAPGASQSIPGFAPLGTYDYISYCGDYPSTIVDSASFQFTVISKLAGDANDWKLSGWFDANQQLPEVTKLFGNYPNPFNPVTTIEYTIAENNDVSLKVYNLLGQKVATLTDGFKDAGHYSVKWNASDYSSGIYFYKLEVGDEMFTKRMILLK
ncbi:MAG: T9SS type A sorting domain-containing protein [candidate division Zixibacteria bacterium]|nr:T9SS type A sorting domain-containing protein [candidate division Zixibacteria bacterium]